MSTTTEPAAPTQARPVDRPAPRREIPTVVIEPRSGWRLVDFKELREYRDLFRFLVWRTIKVRYAQSSIGIGWAIIQPVLTMVVFTVVFGRLARVESDGAPYALFSFCALVPWTYFSSALLDGASSLIVNANMLTKVYFPRILLPLSSVAAKLVDFFIAMAILFCLMTSFGAAPTWGVLFLPLFIALMIITAAGLGMWLTALAVQYRDVKYATGFIVQLLMYMSPVVYPASLIPERFQLIYALNPMVGVIEGFRAAMLGTRPIPWDFLLVGGITGTALAVSGVLFFRSKERLFADVA